MAKRNGLNPYPRIVAELGPGDSLGTGLAALISGCDRYYAFDVVEHANTKDNLRVFDELVRLFRDRVDIPGEEEFPKVKPYLSKYEFPSDILNDDRMQLALAPSRIGEIRDSISDPKRQGSLIRYRVPWHYESVLEEASVDMIYSQAVLEHVDNLREVYKSMNLWLKPTGFISHQIDFKAHGTALDWNGHWKYSDFKWKLLRGRRSYLLNREPHSTHIAILGEEGFRVVCDQRIHMDSSLAASDLAPRFASMSDDDLTTSGAFVQAVKAN